MFNVRLEDEKLHAFRMVCKLSGVKQSVVIDNLMMNWMRDQARTWQTPQGNSRLPPSLEKYLLGSP